MLFLSHAGDDADASRDLARRLRQAGLEVWLDIDQLKPGANWMKALEQAIDDASAFAVYVGRSGVRNFVDREVRAAIVRNTKDPSFRLIPILGPGADRESLPSFLSQHQWVDLREGLTDAEALKALVDAILTGPAERVSILPPGEPPFRGLRAFDREHAELFFGRDAEIDALLDHLRRDPFLSVVGDSGSGKSSLVRAGLIPSLFRGRGYDGSTSADRWRVAVFRPGHDPFASAAQELPRLDPTLTAAERIDAQAACRRELADGAEGLASCVASLTGSGDHVLLVVDQFEELFTQGSDRGERRRFIDSVLGMARAPGERAIHVLITIRADFYSHCWEHPALPGRMSSNQFPVRRMSRDQLLDVIEKPLMLAGARLEPGLAATLLNDVGEEPGSLPLLEHALLLLWERRHGDELTHADYDAIDRLRGALRHQAESVYAQLSDEQQSLARRILIELTQFGEETEDTRRRVAIDDIRALDPRGRDIDDVINRLIQARLLTASHEMPTQGESPADDQALEVAHEALIREWPRLRAWVDENRESLRTGRRIAESAAQWGDQSRNPSYLLQGAALAAAEAWAAEYADDVTTEMRAFIEDGVAARDRAAREAEAKRQREVEMVRRLAEQEKARADDAQRSVRVNRRFSRWLAAAFAVVFVAAGLAALAWFDAERSANEAREAEALEKLSAAEAREQRQLARQAEAQAERSATEAREAEAVALQAKDVAKQWAANFESLIKGLPSKELTASVTEVRGKAQRKSPDGAWEDLAVGDLLREGDMVETDLDSHVAALILERDEVMLIDPMTSMQIIVMRMFEDRRVFITENTQNTHGRAYIKKPEGRDVKELKAVVMAVKGRAQWRANSEALWVEAEVDDILETSAEIRTGRNSSLKLRVGQNAMLLVDRDTRLDLAEMSQVGDRLRSVIGLRRGRADVKVDRAGLTNDFSVITPSGTLAVQG